uniref:Uncharacterized protein n=1 Tax=Oryza glumipatula TaxID=40148 RepID=A0A0D9YUF1_9ORYZ
MWWWWWERRRSWEGRGGRRTRQQRGACGDFVNLKICQPSLSEVLIGVGCEVLVVKDIAAQSSEDAHKRRIYEYLLELVRQMNLYMMFAGQPILPAREILPAPDASKPRTPPNPNLEQIPPIPRKQSSKPRD